MVQRMVLDAAEAEMAEGRIIARTATFALFRSPVTVVDTAGKHSKVNMHYAFCVERTTGRLRVGVWTMRSRSEPQQAPATMVKLAVGCHLPMRARRAGKTDSGNRALFLVVCHANPPARQRAARAACPRRAHGRNNPPPGRSDTDELERLLMKALSTVPDPEIVSGNTAATKSDSTIRRTAIPPPYRRAQ